MRELRVSFEVTDNWSRGEFRQFVEKLHNNVDVELFIITTETDNNIVDAAKNQLGLNSSHVLTVTTSALKQSTIESNAIKIHLDNDVTFAKNLYDNIGTYGIYVTNFWDFYRMKKKYISEFNFRLEQLINEAKGR